MTARRKPAVPTLAELRRLAQDVATRIEQPLYLDEGEVYTEISSSGGGRIVSLWHLPRRDRRVALAAALTALVG